jgi:hypothetical protein
MERQKDSSTVKAAWSILLGLVMALSSFAIPAHDSAQVRACSCCSCAQLDCCGTPVFPNAAPVSVPSKSTEQRAQAPALVIAVLLTTPPASDVPQLSLRSFSVPQGPAVPIYDRNCSYLI